MMRYAQGQVCTLMGDTLERVRILAEGLVLKPERMRTNLDLTDGLIMAEPMMLALGEHVGRQDALKMKLEFGIEFVIDFFTVF